MDPMKRKLNQIQYSNIKTKKLRSITNSEQTSITSLEKLSNEIFYEIFDYLDGFDIYRAFFKLNIRFKHLVTSPSLPLRLTFDGKSLSEIRYICRKVMIPHREQIFSLQLRDSRSVNDVFTCCLIDSSFTRLQSVSLLEISVIQLIAILVYLKSLPHLSSLRVSLKNGYSRCFSDIYRMIFHLPSLKSSQLSVLTEEKLNIFIPLRKNEPFSTIERLIMSHICDLNELHSILRHTPRLKHLTCQNLVESNQNINSEIWMTLPKLTHVSIDDCRVKFDEFENFMKKISSQLKVLHIDGYWNRNFIYPERWQRLICQYMPCLIIFKIKCHLLMNNNQFGHVYFDSFSHQLTSRLCIERGWSCVLDAKPDKIFYLISSKGVCDDQKMAHHLTSQIIDRSSTSIELSVTNYSAVIWRISFIDLLNPILCSIQFTSLHLFWSGMLIGTFIKLLNQLPNLVSLKLSSSLLFLNENFDINDEDQLRINNKITKVWLWKEMKHVTTLIELCPLMEHFEVNGVKDSELISLVHFILTKTKTHILHLHSLRLYTYNADDRMVVELQKMIDREHLLFDYMIQHSDNVIALQWNLN